VVKPRSRTAFALDPRALQRLVAVARHALDSDAFAPMLVKRDPDRPVAPDPICSSSV